MNTPATPPLAFITLTRRNRGSEDTSSLSIHGRINSPGFVCVTSVLSHGTEIAPRTEADRLAMIAWLQSDACRAAVKLPSP